jgi:hypothetical protein
MNTWQIENMLRNVIDLNVDFAALAIVHVVRGIRHRQPKIIYHIPLRTLKIQ